MKPGTWNRWLKIIAWLWVVVIVVMLLLPSEMTYSQFCQIKPGMTLNDAHRLLGKSYLKGGTLNGPVGYGFLRDQSEIECIWFLEEKMWNPNQVAQIPILFDNFSRYPSSIWVGKSYVLWIQSERDVIVYVCLAPITRTGGGFQGCINTIRQLWYDWCK